MGSLSQIKTDIKVKLLPRSSRNQIMGRESDVFKVKVTSPPVDGKANRTLIELLSKKLKLPKKSITIRSGETSRLKSVQIEGMSEDKVRELLT